MYIIWHDNDYDFAKWVYENSILKEKEVLLKSIPKKKSAKITLEKLNDDFDYDILPIIKLATSDLIIQRIEKGKSKIIFVSEFMTHVPQHDHVFQRIERIYCVSKEKIPVAFILPKNKSKLEKGVRDDYKEVKYHPTALAVHTYLKMTLINKNPTLMFFWPDKEGYLKYDSKHQTSPKVESNITNWFNFLNDSILIEDPNKILESKTVKEQINYLENNFLMKNKKFYSVPHKELIQDFRKYYSNKNINRIRIVDTNEAISSLYLDKTKLSKDFLSRDKSLIFEYSSKKFRSTPYCGFICGITSLFCMNEKNEKVLNLIHIPKGISYKEVSKTKRKTLPTFSKVLDNLKECPLHSIENYKKKDIKFIKKHLDKCIYTRSQQQRIFGTVPDLIIFEDEVYYIENG